MAKLTLDDMMLIQDAVAELLESRIGKEFVYVRDPDIITISFKGMGLLRPIKEPEHRDSVPADRHVISDVFPALDADQARAVKRNERYL